MQIFVVNYNPRWPAHYRHAAKELHRAIFPVDVDIEHVGSTAVGGLGAKPIVDIMIGASSVCEIDRVLPALSDLGYIYDPSLERDVPERRFLYRTSLENSFRVHLHAVERNSQFWDDHIAFRDHLRTYPMVAAAYFELKKRLAAQYRDDRLGYTESKTDFILSVLASRKCSQSRIEVTV